MDFKQKYLKYKNKYLELKKLKEQLMKWSINFPNSKQVLDKIWYKS